MLLAIDLGNTSVKLGVFDQGVLVLNSYVDHPNIPTIKTYQTWFSPVFQQFTIKTIRIASVKPQLRHLIVKAIAQLTTIQPTFLSTLSAPNFKLRIQKPEELGVDLLMDAIATDRHYHPDAIIIDVGTATKVMAIRDHGFEGVSIAPGILTSFKALNQNASLIKTMQMMKPTEVFGKNTVSALASGIILGHIHMIEGLIQQGLKGLGLKHAPVIITGGYANWLLPLFTIKVTHDPHLCLKGIALCN